MPARPTLTELLHRLRLLIGDPDSDSRQFTDEELQDFLDSQRTDHRLRRLQPLPDISNDSGPGEQTFTAFPWTNWEPDAVLRDAYHEPLTPVNADWRRGFWTFSNAPREPVTITGKTFDIYAAGADALEVWAARIKLEYDLRTADYEHPRMQRLQAMLLLADRLRHRQRPVRAVLRRNDLC